MNSRVCADDNPKIVKRKYDWDGRFIEISLCDVHQKDPDFAQYVSEELIHD